jgi:hypothetical protein
MVLDSLLATAGRAPGAQDSAFRRSLLEKIRAHPLFSGKTAAEREILSSALEPPFFFDSPGEWDWFDAAKEGDFGPYLERRQASDLYWRWQLNNNEDPTIRAIRDWTESDASPESLLYAAANFTPKAKEQIAAKVARAEANPLFPKEKIPSLRRIDDPSESQLLSVYGADGRERILGSQLDYLEFWLADPAFQKEMKEWRDQEGGMSATTWSALQQKTSDREVFRRLKEMKGPVRDLTAVEACVLRSSTRAANKAIEEAFIRETPNSTALPLCEYLVVVSLWRNEIHGIPADPETVLRLCQDPDFQNKFAGQAGLDYPGLTARLECE